MDLENNQENNQNIIENENKQNLNQELNENISINDIEVTPEKQNSFLNSNIGKFVNTAVDVGLKAILPNFIEDQIIDVKDSLIKGGL